MFLTVFPDMTVPLSWMTYPAETGPDTRVGKSGSLELLEDTESTQNGDLELNGVNNN